MTDFESAPLKVTARRLDAAAQALQAQHQLLRGNRAARRSKGGAQRTAQVDAATPPS